MIDVRNVDLHMHTTVSDGTDQPEEIIGKVKNAGISLFAVTDHDDVKGCTRILEIRRPEDPAFITGVEFSCKDEEGQYHILGYHYDPESEAIRDVVKNGHRLRMKKVTSRLDFLKDEFGFTFPQEEIDHLLSLDNPGKPHIGNLMVKYGYTKTKEEAIKEYINRIHFRSEYVRPEDAIRGILGAGGIPVLAHPTYGSGDQLILGEEMERRVLKLIGYGLQGLEIYYSGFTARIRKGLFKLADQYHLYVTAGSDYHGGNKLIELGETGLKDETEPVEGFYRFLKTLDLQEENYE